MSGRCPWCLMTDFPRVVTADQIACQHPWHGRTPEDKPALATPPKAPLVISTPPPPKPIVPAADDPLWDQETEPRLEMPPSALLPQSLARNDLALLRELAPYAFRGLGMAIAEKHNAGADQEVRRLQLLKEKLEDWVVANR